MVQQILSNLNFWATSKSWHTPDGSDPRSFGDFGVFWAHFEQLYYQNLNERLLPVPEIGTTSRVWQGGFSESSCIFERMMTIFEILRLLFFELTR